MTYIFILLFYLYLLIGFFFGLWFILKGVQKIDPGMQNAKWTMRLLLLPGSVALWPVLWQKYLRRNAI